MIVSEFIDYLKTLPQDAIIETGNMYHYDSNKEHWDNLPNRTNVMMEDIIKSQTTTGDKLVTLWSEE